VLRSPEDARARLGEPQRFVRAIGVLAISVNAAAATQASDVPSTSWDATARVR
jgi:hypothetical protein